MLAVILLAGGGAYAQFTIPPEEVPHISRAQTDGADIEAALQAIGVEIFKFVLPVDTLPAYKVIFHIDQYRADSLVNSQSFNAGSTYRYYTEEQGGPASYFSNSIRLICNAVDAAEPKMSIEFVGAMRMGMQIKKETEHPYGTRPFEAYPLETGVKIPLLMYGSFWKDSNGIVRFCGHQELGKDDEMMKLSPHYHIYSVELQPAQ